MLTVFKVLMGDEKMKKGDIFIIIFVLFMSVISVFTMRTMWQSDSAYDYVNIYINGDEYKRVVLGKPQTVVINREGKYNEIEIKANGVVMRDANCDNKDCLQQGEVNLNNINSRIMTGWIICLPNNVSIELVNGVKN